MTHYHNHCEYNDGQEPDLFAFFVKLRKLLEKKYVNFWYAKYLKKYIQNGISPYGLRVRISPISVISLRHLKTHGKRSHMQALIGEYNQIIRDTD